MTGQVGKDASILPLRKKVYQARSSCAMHSALEAHIPMETDHGSNADPSGKRYHIWPIRPCVFTNHTLFSFLSPFVTRMLYNKLLCTDNV